MSVRIRSERFAASELSSITTLCISSAISAALHIVFDDPRLQSGQIEDVSDHLREPLAALQIQVEQPFLFFRQRARNLFQQQVRRFLHRGERSLQLVRDVGDEVLLHLIHFHELPFISPIFASRDGKFGRRGKG